MRFSIALFLVLFACAELPPEPTQPLGKLATQETQTAIVRATLLQDDVPIPEATVELGRSVSGATVEYTAVGLTDETGRVELQLAGDDVTGYYQIRTSVGRWSSIPINAGQRVSVQLQIGKKARVMASLPLSKMIVFSELDWISAQLQNRIAQYIIEHGYEYPTEVIAGSTIPLFEKLRRGETHVTMEIWLPNSEERLMDAVEAGEVISVGESLGKDWQSAFVIPAYLQEQYPELDSVEDLREDRFKRLFATEETNGKVRLLSCIEEWDCAITTKEQIEGYGLADHVHIVTPKDAQEFNDDLFGAFAAEKPWIGFQWGTNIPALLLDLVRLEEPSYSNECWTTNKACGYSETTISIVVNSNLATRAPDIVTMLQKWDFTLGRYREVIRQHLGADTTLNLNEAALWWLRNRSEVWGEWVTDEAKTKIQRTLR